MDRDESAPFGRMCFLLDVFEGCGEMEVVEEEREREEGKMTTGICEPRCLIRYRSVWEGAARAD